MSDLLKLAERCEKATGPDRELDRAIELAVMPERVNPQVWETLAAYTASLNAALTLVPDGAWAVKCESWPANPVSEEGAHTRAELLECSEKRWGKDRVWGHNGVDNIKSVGEAATPALALCAAALKARAASGMEAGTGETTQIGSTEGDSPVGEAETHDPSSTPSPTGESRSSPPEGGE